MSRGGWLGCQAGETVEQWAGVAGSGAVSLRVAHEPPCLAVAAGAQFTPHFAPYRHTRIGQQSRDGRQRRRQPCNNKRHVFHPSIHSPNSNELDEQRSSKRRRRRRYRRPYRAGQTVLTKTRQLPTEISLTHILTYTLTHILTYIQTHSLTYKLTHSHTNSHTQYSLTHFHTHSH